jgi:hypothetical protein
MSLNRKAMVALVLAAALSIGSFMLLANALQAPEHSVPSPIQMRKDAGEEGPREEAKTQKKRKRNRELRDLPGAKQGQAPSRGGVQPAASPPPPPPAVTGDDDSDHPENDASVNNDDGDDGESDDGESDDGESDDGESDDGESDDGESHD